MRKSLQDICVTIGITCFNAEDTINRAIKSALDQDWQNKEIIIIDDFSCDNSELIIKKTISISGTNIVYIRNKSNRGTSYCRNKIINKSKGDLICFMDDDDLSDPRRVRLQVKQFINNGFPKQKNMACCTGIKKEYSNLLSIS